MDLKHFQCNCGVLAVRTKNEDLVKGVTCDACKTPLALMVVHVIVVNRTPNQIPKEYFVSLGKIPFKL